MGNSIYDMQNNENMLKCLAAQRRDYSLGKRANAYKSFFTVVFAVLAIAASFADNEVLSAISCLCAIVLSIMSHHIDVYVVKQKKHAASIQQYFDVALFSSVIGNSTCDWDDLPTKIDIAESISDIESSEMTHVRNWYSDYSMLSPTEQVFRCQQTNIRWDAKLRSEFKWFIVISSSVLLLLLVFIAIAANPTFVKCIRVLAWILPITDFSFGYYNGLCKDIKRLEALKQQSNLVEQALSSGEACEIQIINLQKLIMENRENSVLIPDWYYNKRQSTHQGKENSIADTVKAMSAEGGEER